VRVCVCACVRVCIWTCVRLCLCVYVRVCKTNHVCEKSRYVFGNCASKYL